VYAPGVSAVEPTLPLKATLSAPGPALARTIDPTTLVPCRPRRLTAIASSERSLRLSRMVLPIGAGVCGGLRRRFARGAAAATSAVPRAPTRKREGDTLMAPITGGVRSTGGDEGASAIARVCETLLPTESVAVTVTTAAPGAP
jgi:hypothetical protein